MTLLRTSLTVCTLLLLATTSAFASNLELTPNLADPDLKKELSYGLQAADEGIVGDSIDLDSGTLGLSATDVAIPGNFDLPVAFSRSYTLDGVDYHGGVLGSWNIDVPFITARVLEDNLQGANDPNNTKDGWKNNRCTSTLRQWFPHTNVTGNDLQQANDDSWAGAKMFIPGEGGKVLLEAVAGSTAVWGVKPKKTTTDHWKVDCLTSLQNGPGEGFSATSPNGDVYRFDYWAPKGAWILGAFSSSSEPCGMPFCPPSGAQVAHAIHANIYATQVTDKNGNWVKYDYSNGRLTKIHSSDGRVIDVSYQSGTDRISTVVANGRTWTYSYEYVLQGSVYYWNLDKVTQPDGLFWDYGLEPQKPFQRGHPCSGAVTSGSVSVKHPYGANATFDYTLTKNGKNNVDGTIDSWTGVIWLNGVPVTITAGCNNYRVPSYTVSKAVTQKTLNIPGSSTAVWDYWYEQDDGYHNAPNATSAYDLKKRIVTGPEGFESHLWYNRRHLSDDEGQLMKSETWDGSTKDQQVDYNYLEGPSLGDSSVRMKFSPPRTSERLTTSIITSRDSDTFTTTGLYNTSLSSSSYSFNAPTSVSVTSNVHSSSRTTVAAYEHKRTPWVIGLTKTLTINGRQIVDYDYDSLGRRTVERRYGQTAFTFGYHTGVGYKGALHWYKNALNHTTYALNWKRGTAQQIKRPDNDSVYQYVDNNGWLTSAVDARGNTASYSRDSMGRLTLVNPPGSWANTSISYSFSGGGAVETTTKGQSRTTTTYDGLFRPVLERTQALDTGWSSYVNTSYDGNGQVAFQSQPSSSSTETAGTDYVYDALGRITTATETVSPFAQTRYEYHSGHRRRVYDPSNAWVDYYAYGYDGPGNDNYRAIYNSAGQHTYITKNIWGEMTDVRQWGTQNGYTVDKRQYYYYDAQSRLCRHYVPEHGATKYAYDAAGQLTAYAKGQSNSGCTVPSTNARVSLSYDVLGQPTTTSFSDPATPDISRSYDDDGNLLTVNRSGVNWTYAYNELNLLDSESLALDGRSYALSYLYDTSGNLTRRVLPTGRQINVTPDGLGRPTVIEDGSATLASGIAYHPSGALQGMTYGNGQVMTQTLNGRLLPSRLHSIKGSHNAIDLRFIYDARANITSIVNAAIGGDNRSYGYDAMSRLTTATGPWGSGSYTYDALNNLRTKALGSRNVTTSYDGNNRLTQSVDTGASGTRSLGYDARGNVTSLGGQTFVYDYSDQPVSIAGSVSGTYTYDGHLKRVKAVVDGKTIYNVYDASGSLVHVDELTDGDETDYVAGPAGSLARIKNNTVTYLHPDHLGSAQSGTDSAGSVLWREQYTPYGEELQGHTANDDQAGFTGHIRDKATGLNYMQARYYDPIVGRFLSIDPVDFRQTGDPAYFNRYAYVGNNPVNAIDPNGEAANLALRGSWIVGREVGKRAAAPAINFAVRVGTANKALTLGGLFFIAIHGDEIGQMVFNEESGEEVADSDAGPEETEKIGADKPEVGECPDCGGTTSHGKGKIASDHGLTPKDVGDRIHGAKSGKLDGNPDVEVCKDCGEMFPQTADGGLGDSIGNIDDGY